MVVSLAPPPDGPLADRFRARGVDVRAASPSGRGSTRRCRCGWPRCFGRSNVGVVHTHNRQPLIYARGRGQAGGRQGGAHPARARARHAQRAVVAPGGRVPPRRLRRGVARARRRWRASSATARRQAEGDRERDRSAAVRRRGGVERTAARAGFGIAGGRLGGRVGGPAGARKGVPPAGARRAPLLGPGARLAVWAPAARPRPSAPKLSAPACAEYVSLPGVAARHSAAAWRRWTPLRSRRASKGCRCRCWRRWRRGCRWWCRRWVGCPR